MTTRTPKRPAHRKRTSAPKPTPTYTRANHGLTQIAKTHNVSYASLYRQYVTLGSSLLAAVDYCKGRGLTWITPGTTRLGQRRNSNKPKA